MPSVAFNCPKTRPEDATVSTAFERDGSASCGVRTTEERASEAEDTAIKPTVEVVVKGVELAQVVTPAILVDDCN